MAHERIGVDEFNRSLGKLPHKAQPRFKGKRETKYGKRHLPGVMNQTETAYSEMLQVRQEAGEIAAWWFEAIKFKLADNCHYSPDFAVLFADGSMEFIDAKGGGPIDDKSVVKIKVAAEKFPMFRFVMEQKRAKKHGGGWKRKEF